MSGSKPEGGKGPGRGGPPGTGRHRRGPFSLENLTALPASGPGTERPRQGGRQEDLDALDELEQAHEARERALEALENATDSREIQLARQNLDAALARKERAAAALRRSLDRASPPPPPPPPSPPAPPPPSLPPPLPRSPSPPPPPAARRQAPSPAAPGAVRKARPPASPPPSEATLRSIVELATRKKARRKERPRARLFKTEQTFEIGPGDLLDPGELEASSRSTLEEERGRQGKTGEAQGLGALRRAFALWVVAGFLCASALIGSAHSLAWPDAAPMDHVLFAVQNVTFSGPLLDVSYAPAPSPLRLVQQLVALASAVVGTTACSFLMALVVLSVLAAFGPLRSGRGQRRR